MFKFKFSQFKDFEYIKKLLNINFNIIKKVYFRRYFNSLMTWNK